MKSIKTFKVLITVANGDVRSIRVEDAIEYKGSLWLVPDWIEVEKSKYVKPKRLIAVSRNNLLDVRGQSLAFDFLLDPQKAIPINVLLGLSQKDNSREYETVEEPAITLVRPVIH